MMNFILTGANGYIGRHVAKYLLDNNQTVIAVDIDLSKVDERAIKILCNIFESKINFSKYKPDVLIHLAWQDGFNHNAESHIKNLYAHYEFLKDLEQQNIEHFVVMGSMHEIGYHEGEILEDTPCNPLSLYGIAKNTLRQLLITNFQNKNICFQWLRAYYIYDDDYNNHSIFTKILQAEKEHKEFFPFTTGKNKYDFITVYELAKQIACTAMQTKITGIINCCSGKPVALKDKIEDFIKSNNLKIKLDYGKFHDRTYDSPILYGNADKINKILENE